MPEMTAERDLVAGKPTFGPSYCPRCLFAVTAPYQNLSAPSFQLPDVRMPLPEQPDIRVFGVAGPGTAPNGLVPPPPVHRTFRR